MVERLRSAAVKLPRVAFQARAACAVARSPSEVSKIVVKDNICTTGHPTACASAMLQNFVSPFNATIVDKLEAAGRIVIAKGNMDEFGMGSDNIHSIHGPVKNIYTRDGDALSPGGSSGGSAVAVASGLCDA